MTDTAALQQAAAPIAAEAKKSFSLAERLKGVKLTTRKVIVFTDEDDVADYGAAERELLLLEARLGDPEISAEDRALMDERAAALEARKVAARSRMLQGALSVHMRAVPDVVMDAGRRAARKAYAVDGQIPDELIADANQVQQGYVLGRVVQKIVDSTGAAAEFDRDEVADMLRGSLPLPQWTRIVTAYNAIVFTDAIGEQATLDPGF